MPVTIAICEDEKQARDEILRLVKSRRADCHADLYDSGDALFRANKQYDIYILDIQMPGVSGLEASRRIRSVSPVPVIIFVTALREHMQDAFDVRAYHFLTKPIDENKFISVLSGAVEECRKRSERANIIVRSGGTSHVVQLNDILFAESRNKKVVMRTSGGQIEYYGKISEFDGNPAFYRCHRCYVVNMDHIVRYDANTIYVSDGLSVPIAEKKCTDFVKAYMKHAMK